MEKEKALEFGRFNMSDETFIRCHKCKTPLIEGDTYNYEEFSNIILCNDCDFLLKLYLNKLPDYIVFITTQIKIEHIKNGGSKFSDSKTEVFAYVALKNEMLTSLYYQVRDWLNKKD